MKNKFRKWKQDDNHLKQLVGTMTLPKIAQIMGRSQGGVERRLERLGISTKDSTYLITAYTLASLLNVDSHTVLLWINKYGLPARRKVTKFKRENLFVNPTKFWKWAFNNKKRVNFAKIPRFSILPEPVWVEEERKIDRAIPARTQQVWSDEEESILIQLTLQGGWTQRDIAAQLQRSTRAVQKHTADLREKGRLPEKKRVSAK